MDYKDELDKNNVLESFELTGENIKIISNGSIHGTSVYQKINENDYKLMEGVQKVTIEFDVESDIPKVNITQYIFPKTI